MKVSAGSERSLRVLGAEKVRAIHEASLRVLSETGVVMPLAPRERDQAHELGLLVDSRTERVRFPPEIVTQTLARAPSSYGLCGRSPEHDLLLDGRQSHLSLDGSAVALIDLETGDLRPSTRADLESAVRVADALGPISILCPALSAADCAPREQPLVETAALLTQSSKHAQTMTVVDGASAEAAVQMAAEIAGGPEALRERPILSGFQCSISPLSYHADSLRAALVFAAAYGAPAGARARPRDPRHARAGAARLRAADPRNHLRSSRESAMSNAYAVLGSGRQGTAAAYDMARFGEAKRVLLADLDLAAAEDSAARVNRLLDENVAQARRVDVTDPEELVSLLGEVDAFVSAVPYWLNPLITGAAIRAGACMTDLGGNTDLVRKQMRESPEAEKAGITVIPDCGQVPGMGTSLITYCMSKLDRTDDVMMWDGGNAAEPRPPFNYILTFNIAGLTNEYYGVAHFIREGRRVEVPTFLPEDYETIELPDPIGEMEAFVAGGGTSTMPWSFEGKLQTLWNKTLRWPGHFAQWKAYMDAGLLEEQPIEVEGSSVSPRQVLHALMEPKIRAKPGEPDFVVVRVLAQGIKDGKSAKVLVELIDRYDPDTGFTAMERTTGWDASIKAIMTVQGHTPPGVHPAELAVPPERYVEELRRRGFALRESVE